MEAREAIRGRETSPSQSIKNGIATALRVTRSHFAHLQSNHRKEKERGQEGSHKEKGSIE